MATFDTLLKHTDELGRVIGVTGTIVMVDGLPHVRIGEEVIFETGESGIVHSLGESSIVIIVFSRDVIRVDTRVVRTGKEISAPIGDDLIGSTINALGKFYTDGMQHTRKDADRRPIFVDPPGIAPRRKITRQMETGITLIDSLVPIGFGQRELIIGDRKTGKTQILLSSIETQAKRGTICIYGAIGKRKTEIKEIEAHLVSRGIRDRCIIVFASSYASPGEIYVTPYAAMMLAEYFTGEGKDVLLVLDDLTMHARYYRELSLLSKNFPGRDSYPGDIFHMHAKLLERAGNFVLPDGKEVSITVLPIAETAGSDITGYIQTNLMSMTDGHLFCDTDLFFRGVRPAINPFLSVTRIGKQTQTPLGRDIAQSVLKTLSAYEKALGFVRFGADVSAELKQVLAIGEALWNVFEQKKEELFPMPLQYVLIAHAYTGTWTEEVEDDLYKKYQSDTHVRKTVDDAVGSSKTLEELKGKIGS